MIVDDINFTLKDGRAATLRSPREEDIEGTRAYLIKSSGETHFLLRYPEECKNFTYELEKTIFDDMNSSANGAMLVCAVDGKIAGTCTITQDNWIKTRHRANIAVALLSEYWGQGIGSKMLEALIEIAGKMQYVEQIELEYIEGNSRARALYEKFGFRIVGVRPKAYRLKEGTYLNEYIMIKELQREER